MRYKDSILKCCKLFLLSGLYLSFFAVQIFYNFDIASAKRNQHTCIKIASDTAAATSHSFFHLAQFSSKANIRLNKRFEPVSIPECQVPVFECSCIPYIPQKWGIQPAPFFQDAVHHTAPLRGPPVIA